jgi:integrase
MASEPRAAEREGAVADPVAFFLEEITYHGRSERTQAAYERVLRRFETFLTSERGVDIADATRRDCLAWVHSLRDSYAQSTVATYASYVHRCFSYLGEVDALDENPMALVTEEMDERIDTDPTRREIDVREMRSFVGAVRHPLDRALVVTLLKTGVRVGELCNLDRRDLHLGGSEQHRATLDGRPNSLFVAAEPELGAVVNGEERAASNKRKRDTVVPVDRELRHVLRRWLAVRPDPRSAADPLFLSTREWGRRVTPGMVRSIVTEHATDADWYRSGGDAAENVTPHYFRHFFTTHLRDRIGDRGVVKYLRGDVADDIVDTYTHSWGDRVRDVYISNIYSVLPRDGL